MNVFFVCVCAKFDIFPYKKITKINISSIKASSNGQREKLVKIGLTCSPALETK